MLRRLAAWLVALLAAFTVTPADALDASDVEERRGLEPSQGQQSAAAELLPSLQPDVGRIRITSGADVEGPLSIVMLRCRDRGDLKVQLVLPRDTAPVAIDGVAERCGLLFSRQRHEHGEIVAEYYVDLYAIPRPATGAASSI